MLHYLSFVGDVPLHIAIRETSDAGRPIVISDPDSPQVSVMIFLSLNFILVLETSNLKLFDNIQAEYYLL